MTTIRVRRSLIGAVLASLTALACSDEAGTNPFADAAPPTVSLAQASSGTDTVLAFNATVQDNLGIKRVTVAVSGGVAASFDTTFTSAVTNTTLNYRVSVPRSVPTGTAVVVTAVASDGAGNQSDPVQLVLGVGNVAPSVVVITSPPSGTVAVLGKSLILAISAKAATGVRSVGFRASGVFTHADSSVFSSPLRDSVALTDTLTIPENSPTGQLTVTPFVIDSLGQRTLGPAISISVQTAASSTQVPTVTFGINPRVEVNDTIHVSASDPTGITQLGYEVRVSAAGAVAAEGSIVAGGNFSTLTHTFTLHLHDSLVARTVYVQAFATNSNGARAYARLASGLTRVDTVLVVAGTTTPLTSGGAIADALYHPGRDRLYMTNIERNRVEVFALAEGRFEAPIATGSRPWGIAAWPVDRNGTVGDRLLVANSGGTSISYINVSINAQDSVYALPNLVAYAVTSVQSSTAPGQVIQQRTRYDFSDRPQYLAATCRPADGNACGDRILVYSTTPTGGQSLPFPRKGTLRYENLSQRTSHFFFEQAVGQGAARADTLEIVRFKAFGSLEPDSTILVPYRNRLISADLTDTIPFSVVVDVERLGFRDTTFARNSGNFARAVFGEGGPVLGSRAMIYNADAGRVQSAVLEGVTYNYQTVVFEAGVSRAADVSDYTANTFARVGGVAMNFDGTLAAIRGDSTFLLDPTLRLQGMLQTSGGNAGFDFHPQHTGNPNGLMSSCYAFAASAEPLIDVFETRHYSRFAPMPTIPLRDPIIGPIKAARRPSGEVVLVGATQRGVVVVRVPGSALPAVCP
jgi:hypothetical protein